MSYTPCPPLLVGALLPIYPYDFCLYPLVTPLQKRCRAHSKSCPAPALCRAGNALHRFLLSHMNQGFIRDTVGGGAASSKKGGNTLFLMLGGVRPLFSKRGVFCVGGVARRLLPDEAFPAFHEQTLHVKHFSPSLFLAVCQGVMRHRAHPRPL